MKFFSQKTFTPIILMILVLFLASQTGCTEKAGNPTNEANPATRSGSSAKDEGIKAGKIVFVDQGDIWVMDLGSGEKKNITCSPENETRPRWSPDGKKIAFTRQERLLNVYIVNADGSGLTRLTGGTPGSDFAPAWSPDGKKITFLSSRDRPDSKFPNAEIYLMNPDGSVQTRLTGGFELENPDCLWWSFDGSQIAVHEEGTGGGTGISLVNAATGKVGRIEALREAMKKEGIKFSLINFYLFNPRDTNLIACSLYDMSKGKGDSKNGVYIFDQGSGSLKKICSYDAGALGWFRDGTALVYLEKGRIYSIQKDGAGPVMLEDLTVQGPGTDYSELDLYWPGMAPK